MYYCLDDKHVVFGIVKKGLGILTDIEVRIKHTACLKKCAFLINLEIKILFYRWLNYFYKTADKKKLWIRKTTFKQSSV